MRRPRVKVDGEGFYHVVSRIGGKRFLLDEAEKGVLLGMIRAAAAFSGVELYTYAVMSNHFHLLVRVPRRREVSDAELLRRMRALYGPAKLAKVLEKWDKWTNRGMEARVDEEKGRLRARTYDLSQFCKTFKEAYTQDYNRRHGNTGTIWEGRFKSILLEDSRRALMTVAGYIHLNPVRAGMVGRAETAGNAGYGAACLGDERARQGLGALVRRACAAGEASWPLVREACAEVIEGTVPGAKASQSDPFHSDGGGGSAPAPEALLSYRTLLRRRVTGFLHGNALGGVAFLRRVAAILPPRIRRRAKSLLDSCPFLSLSSASGVRDAS